MFLVAFSFRERGILSIPQTAATVLAPSNDPTTSRYLITIPAWFCRVFSSSFAILLKIRSPSKNAARDNKIKAGVLHGC